MKKIILILSILLVFSGCSLVPKDEKSFQETEPKSTIAYVIEKELIHPEDPSLPVKIAIIGKEYLNKESLNTLGQELKQQYQKYKENIMIIFLVDKNSVDLVEKKLKQTLNEEESARLTKDLAATYSSYKEGSVRKKMYQINEEAL